MAKANYLNHADISQVKYVVFAARRKSLEKELPHISVIMCTYNRAHLLNDVVGALLRQKKGNLNYDIVIVDDNSSDKTENTVKRIMAAAPISIEYVRGPGKGEPSARNTGLQVAKGPWIAFIDDDEIADQGWIAELIKAAVQTGASIVGGARKLAISEKERDGLHPRILELLGEEEWYNSLTRLSGHRYPNTGNVLLHRRVFDEIGLFDESMIYGGTDTDLMMRARRAGYPQWFAPAAIVHHLTPPSRLIVKSIEMCSMRQGLTKAMSDYKFSGRFVLLLSSMARLLRFFLKDFWLLFVARRFFSSAQVAQWNCSFYRSVGYVKGAFTYLLPFLFSREDVYSGFVFRSQRRSNGQM